MRAALSLALCASAVAQLPSWPATWQLNKSTIVMICNYTGLIDPSTLGGWSIIDFDWSNALQVWAKGEPMNDEQLLLEQAQITKAALPDAYVWIYRNSIYAYPWYDDVRTILEDPAYEPWFIKYKPNGPYINPPCDNNYDPPLCTTYFRMLVDTPNYPSGYGDCNAPRCDCGTVPCGFYLWNHSSTAVVNGQTFQQWFINSYVFNAVGSSPLVSGFFFDDFWPGAGGVFPDSLPGITNDAGMSPAAVAAITDAYNANMAALRNATLAAGKFAWQQLWTGGAAGGNGGTCPSPLVTNASCAADLRALCAPDSPAQSRAMMYAFYPGGCRTDPGTLQQADEDIANFLLVRGPYAYIGHGWLGCSRSYEYPQALNADYGAPLGLCAETGTGTGVFTREYSKATVQMDCNSFTPLVRWK